MRKALLSVLLTVNAANTLKEAGINAVSYVSENTRHEFQTWRRSLRELSLLLFIN